MAKVQESHRTVNRYSQCKGQRSCEAIGSPGVLNTNFLDRLFRDFNGLIGPSKETLGYEYVPYRRIK